MLFYTKLMFVNKKLIILVKPITARVLWGYIMVIFRHKCPKSAEKLDFFEKRVYN